MFNKAQAASTQVDADPYGSAVRDARTPRLSAHEIAFMLAAAARVPSVLLAARYRLDASHFESSEAHFVLLWRALVRAADDGKGVLPRDAVAAREIVSLKTTAELATDPGRLFYTAKVAQLVTEEGGLLDEIYALPADPAVEAQGFDLLAKFLTERVVADPLRRALAGVNSGETVTDPRAVAALIEEHALSIAGIGRRADHDAVLEDVDYRPALPQLVTTRIGALDELTSGGQAVKECNVILGPTGGGKCFAKGTPILMFDGSVKAVEDVAVGDLLMGPDSRPRRVLGLGRGREPMYRIEGGDRTSYTVNESHILALRLCPEKKGQGYAPVNLTVRDYLTRSKSFKHRARGYRVSVDFPSRPVPIDPYFLGLWLACGSAHQPAISKPDPEVAALMAEVAAVWGLEAKNHVSDPTRCPTWVASSGRTGGKANPLLSAMRALDVINNKHVPALYLYNDRTVRAALLAGILDGDGHLKHHGVGYEFCSTEQRLAEAVTYLARSLGFLVSGWSINGATRTTHCQTGAACASYRLEINGPCDKLPIRIARKKAAPRRRVRDVLAYSVRNVVPLGEGDYYGFEIDGDRLFLLGDFTVAHNTSIGVQLSVDGAELQNAIASELGPDRAGHWYYFTYELNTDQLRERIYSYGAKIHHHTYVHHLPYSTAEDRGTVRPYEYDPYVNSPGLPFRGERERIRDFVKRMAGANGRLHVVDYSGAEPGVGGGGVREIAAYLRTERDRGRQPVGFVVDYAGLAVQRQIGADRRLKPDHEYNLLAGFVDAVRNQACVPLACSGWVLHQLHGDATKRAPGSKVHHSEARGCRNFADNSDFSFQLSTYNKSTGMLVIHCTKHRRAPGREDGVITRFDGRFGAFLAPDQDYVVDPQTRQIVPRDFVDALPTRSPGPGGPPVDPRGAL